jgi:hypothetical protein
MALSMGYGLVVGIFCLALGTLWFLKTKLGMRPKATVSGEVDPARSRLRVTSTGTGGYFLALVIFVLAAVFIVVKFLN